MKAGFYMTECHTHAHAHTSMISSSLQTFPLTFPPRRLQTEPPPPPRNSHTYCGPTCARGSSTPAISAAACLYAALFVHVQNSFNDSLFGKAFCCLFFFQKRPCCRWCNAACCLSGLEAHRWSSDGSGAADRICLTLFVCVRASECARFCFLTDYPVRRQLARFITKDNFWQFSLRQEINKTFAGTFLRFQQWHTRHFSLSPRACIFLLVFFFLRPSNFLGTLCFRHAVRKSRKGKEMVTDV